MGLARSVGETHTKSAGEILQHAAGSAFKGGFAGVMTGVLQVLCFMWLRTAMNHQYYRGGDLPGALSELWAEGGVVRFYRGLGWALIQNPTSRFGDTFANMGTLALFAALAPQVPAVVTTLVVATVAASWRIFITPIDTFKTTLQVQGDKALDILWERTR